MAALGIASSIITDKAPEAAPIVITCDGPCTRIYCLYDDDSFDESDANEGSLGYFPFHGDWNISLPCSATDLSWVQNALKKIGGHITARDQNTNLASKDEISATSDATLVIDEKGFLG